MTPRLVPLVVLSLTAMACWTPVDDEPLPADDAGQKGTDAGHPGTDGGRPDAGAGDAGTFEGTYYESCAPADGPASRFDFSTASSVTCPGDNSSFNVEVWTGTSSLTPKSYALSPSSADATAAVCASAVSCSLVKSGTFVIDTVSDGVVEGSVNLVFTNGQARVGRVHAVFCGVDAGVPLPFCG